MPRTPTALRAILAASLVSASACNELSSPVALGSAATSGQIQAARDAADGVPLDLPIAGAFVTYVRPAALGGDAAGFFVQSQPTGPALFVAVDPATLTPAPRAGDRVDLIVTSMATVDGRREASSVAGFALVEAGLALGGLQQDLSAAADLVSALGSYESELASVTGVLREAPAGSGDGFASAGLATAALPVEPALVFRLPVALRDQHDLTLGCRVTVAMTPVWRGLKDAQPAAQITAWAAADLDVVGCPAPRVVSAAALSSTTVLVTFDRLLDPDAVLADGGQFSFDAGLATSAAEVTGGREVTLTTAPQASGTAYQVTVAPTVVDRYGATVDPAFDVASFTGFAVPAVLRLSEVRVATGGAGLVELEVVGAGSVHDFALRAGDGAAGLLATLPDLVVAAGAVLVVHLEPAAGVVTETLAAGDCGDDACHAGAWDVAGVDATNLNPASSRVITVASADGTLQDAVPFTDLDPTGVTTFLADLEALQSAEPPLWTLCADPDTGAPVACPTTAEALAISVDWSGMVDLTSMTRVAADDTNTSADWAPAASSFGSLPIH